MKYNTILSTCLLLTACSTEDPRYRNTDMLERPPIIETKKVELDTSIIPRKKITTGLGDDVSLTNTMPAQLNIKLPYDEAWHILGLALKQSGIEITDREHDKGLYYVLYAPEALLFGKAGNPAIYVLTVSKNGAETHVNASIGNDNEQSSASGRDNQRIASKADRTAHATEGTEQLMQTLYKMLHDELKEE